MSEMDGVKAAVLASQILILFFGLSVPSVCVCVCVCVFVCCTSRQELERVGEAEWENMF